MLSDIRCHDSQNRPHSRVIYRRLNAWKRWTANMQFLRQVKAEIKAKKAKDTKWKTQAALDEMVHPADLPAARGAVYGT